MAKVTRPIPDDDTVEQIICDFELFVCNKCDKNGCKTCMVRWFDDRLSALVERGECDTYSMRKAHRNLYDFLGGW